MIRKFLQRKFVRDTLFMQATTLVQGATFLGTSILLARYLGDFELGRWDFARTLFTFTFFLMTMGVGNATISRYSAAVARQDRAACVDALAVLLKLGLVMCTLAVTLGWWALPWISEYRTGDPVPGRLAWILCTVGMFEVLRTFGMAALVGARLMRQFAVIDIISNVGRVALVVLAIVLDGGLEGIAWAITAHFVLGGLLAAWAYRQARAFDEKVAPPPLRDVLRAVPKSSMRELLRTSLFLAMNKGLHELVPLAGVILMVGFSFEETGVFGVARKISWGLALLVGGVGRAFLPALGYKIGSSDVPIEDMGPTIKRVTIASGLIFAALTTAAVLVVPWVLATWYGPEFEGGFDLFLGLVVGNYMLGFAVAIEPFYLFTGRLKVLLYTNLVAYVTWLLIASTAGVANGPMGIAWAVGLARLFIVFHLLYMWWFFRRVRARKAALESPSS